MKHRLFLELTPRPLERAESDVAVAGFFSDERPLRGGLARADWRLCGGLSKRIERGDLLGKSGEAMLIGCGRALRAPRLLVVGLGSRPDFDRIRFSDETRAVMRRCIALRCERIALAPLGIAPDDMPRHSAALVAGIREACVDLEGPLQVQLCIQAAEIPGTQRAIEEACRAAGANEFEIRGPEPVSRVPATPGASGAVRGDPQAPSRSAN